MQKHALPCFSQHSYLAVLCPQAQMVAKQQRRAAEQTQKLEEVEAHRQAEAAYQQRISTLLEKAEPRQYYGRRKVDWFT